MNKAKDKYEKLEKKMFQKKRSFKGQRSMSAKVKEMFQKLTFLKMNMKNLSKQKRFFKKINLLKNKSNLQ